MGESTLIDQVKSAMAYASATGCPVLTRRLVLPGAGHSRGIVPARDRQYHQSADYCRWTPPPPLTSPLIRLPSSRYPPTSALRYVRCWLRAWCHVIISQMLLGDIRSW
eukprot:1477317-Rhodomonas_salina.3